MGDKGRPLIAGRGKQRDFWEREPTVVPWARKPNRIEPTVVPWARTPNRIEDRADESSQPEKERGFPERKSGKG